MSKNTVRVYDTITKKYVEVEVNETVRTLLLATQNPKNAKMRNNSELAQKTHESGANAAG